MSQHLIAKHIADFHREGSPNGAFLMYSVVAPTSSIEWGGEDLFRIVQRKRKPRLLVILVIDILFDNDLSCRVIRCEMSADCPFEEVAINQRNREALSLRL